MKYLATEYAVWYDNYVDMLQLVYFCCSIGVIALLFSLSRMKIL